MKIHVIHDDSGVIRGTLVASSETPEVGVGVSTGLRVFVVDRPDVTDDEKLRLLAELHASHKVQFSRGETELVKVKEKGQRSKKN